MQGDRQGAQLIDGKAMAARVRGDVMSAVRRLKTEYDVTPGLAVVLVGENPASQVYVRNKGKQTLEAGMTSFEHRLDAGVSEAELLSLIDTLNRDPAVHGILVQLPLPDHITESAVIAAIAPEKDVDGFHVINAGRLATGAPAVVPCTPLGSMMMIAEALPHLAGDYSGLTAVVIGRSNIVGKPMAQLLLSANATVTVAHSRTKNLPAVARTADILVAAVGRPNMVGGDWVKPGAVLIDVGINRVDAPERGDGKTRLVGDIDFEAAREVAGAITPVPGGVGPMTIACLLVNCLRLACAAHDIQPSRIGAP
ncbi:MAG: bifunctional methylenetetrahydrofolate dehydrogenase/methenyltetrahydrofolate cyclohydrolase FolD [Pseudomonadota bacterium]